MEQNMTLEQANDLLEQAIKQRENEARPMSESVEVYARACELMAFCMKELEGYRGRIDEVNEKLTQYIAEGNHE